MSLLSLPTELVLSIVELAAWHEVDSNRGWVARLCLVCRTFRSAAMGPLYHTVHIPYKKVVDVAWTIRLEETPFSRTRRVTVSSLLGQLPISSGHFTRAFASVEYLSASTELFKSLAQCGQALRCAMVSITTELADDADCELLRPLLEGCTHLHILLSIEEWDSDGEDADWRLPDVRRLLGPRTTRLIVDPTMVAEDLPAERVEKMAGMVLDLPCERVLFRTQQIRGEAVVREFCTLVGSMARDRRDQRAWIDETPRDPNRSLSEHECDDAKRGWALWEAGRPLYVLE